MKKINTLTMMILLTFSFSIAQELEVEGDLTVTGTIESVTIDSLEQDIASLQLTLLATGQTELTFNNQTAFRDKDNNEVDIVETVKGIILVE